MIKEAPEQLAILNGPRAFAAPVHVGRPSVGNRERLLARINDLLDRRWLSNHGPFVAEFEQRIAEFTGARHCVAMCNGTIALEIAIRALGMKGEVIVPSFTFIATAHALQWQEITPVFCDLDPATHNLDPDRIEELITPRTTGIIGVHLWGRPCATERLVELARRRNLRLMYDAAHAFGCSHAGQMIGNFGDAEVFSFHATKFLNSFEGGAVVTNSDELAAKMRLMKNFGFKDYDEVIYPGTNGKMTEICAAMGLTMLEEIDDLMARNRQAHELYARLLADVPGLKQARYPTGERSNCQYCVYEVFAAEYGLTRDELLRVLHAENVLARRYFYPGCHRMEPYRSYYPHAGLLLPETEKVCDRVLVLPTGAAVSDDDIASICALIRLAGAHVPALRTALRGSAGRR